jgi:hypothetical protein
MLQMNALCSMRWAEAKTERGGGPGAHMGANGMEASRSIAYQTEGPT